MYTYLQNLIAHAPNRHISYADFISAALYHPQLGYYMKDKQKIGRQGDFITTSNISDVYGRMMAKWFANACEKTGLPAAICEIGAGTGRFAHAFLQEWTEVIQTPLQYFVVETSPFHRKLQAELLHPYSAVIQVETLKELTGFKGMVFSNELFDALPVHVIENINNELYEVMVGMENGKLCERMIPLANPAILNFLRESGLRLKEKQRLEIPLAMETMLLEISSMLKQGFVVTVDYGFTNEEWMNPKQIKGSLRGFFQHKLIDSILEHPGEMDITTHIHWDYLIQKGAQLNLEFISKLGQDLFLLKAGILKELENHYDPNPFSEVSKRNRAIRSLIMPSGMSSYFQIAIQQKGLALTAEDLFEQ